MDTLQHFSHYERVNAFRIFFKDYFLMFRSRQLNFQYYIKEFHNICIIHITYASTQFAIVIVAN